MNEQELNSYEEQEEHNAAKLLYKFEREKYVTICDFFQELRLSPPYTRLNMHPFWIGLPFYKTLIFDIYPFASEDILQRAHGVTVSQLLALQDDGKIQIILAGPPQGYVGLDYLDPILRRRPPSYTYRLSAFAASLHGIQALGEWQEEGKELFWGKLEKLRKAIGVATDQPVFEGSAIGAWVNLRTLGLTSLVETIKFLASKDAYTAGIFVDIFHELICAPITTCLRGCHSVPIDYMNTYVSLFQKYGVNLERMKPDFEGGFPTEIGRLLIERYRLIRPKTLSEAIEIYPDYAEARQALKALMKYVEDNKIERINSAAQTVSKAFDEIYKIKSRKKKFETSFQVTGIVGAAALGLTGQVAGFLGAIGFGLLGSSLASPLSESIAKLTAHSNIVTLFDFDGKLTKKWSAK